MNLELLPNVLVGAVILSGIYLLVGLSWVIVFRASQLMNFATGQLLALAAFVAATVITGGWNYWITLVIVVIGMALFGAFYYRVLLRPLAGSDLFTPVIATMGVAAVVQGVIQVIWGPNILNIQPPFPNEVLRLPLGILVTTNDLIVPAAGILFYVALIFFLRRTKFGGQMRAANESTLLASQSGMNVYLIIGVAFAISFAAIALAGILNAQRSVVALGVIPLGLKGLVPAMLGGLTSVEGVAVGALIVAFLETFVVLTLGSDWSDFAVFFILLLVLALRPNGIFGRAEAQRV